MVPYTLGRQREYQRVRIAGSATYLVDRARRRLRRGALLAVCGVIGTVGGFIASQQTASPPIMAAGNVAVFVGLGSLLLGVQQLTSAGRDREASLGEDPVVTQLRARLSDDYYYLRRVTIPGHGVEADGILLGPSGALVLAIRALQGRYAVRGNDWFVVDGEGAERLWNRSPTWELARPMRALQRAMQEQGLLPVPVQGAVVLVEGRLLEAERPAAAVVPVDRIASYVDYLRVGEGVTPDSLAGLATYLEPHVGGGSARKRSGGLGHPSEVERRRHGE